MAGLPGRRQLRGTDGTCEEVRLEVNDRTLGLRPLDLGAHPDLAAVVDAARTALAEAASPEP